MDRVTADAPDAIVGAGPVRPAEPTTAAQRIRRERIVRAAMDLLSEHGYDEIQMRDVAVGAGVALGTLYRYFPSKEQLFAHVLLEWSASFDEAMRRRRPERGNDAERLRVLLRRAVGAFERQPNYFQLLSVLEVSKDPAVVEPFATYSGRFMAAIGEALSDTDPEDVAVLTVLATSLLSTLLRGWWLGRHSIRTVNARIDRAVDVLFEGARPR
jgi:AcrR family transcriptional regulator